MGWRMHQNTHFETQKWFVYLLRGTTNRRLSPKVPIVGRLDSMQINVAKSIDKLQRVASPGEYVRKCLYPQSAYATCHACDHSTWTSQTVWDRLADRRHYIVLSSLICVASRGKNTPVTGPPIEWPRLIWWRGSLTVWHEYEVPYLPRDAAQSAIMRFMSSVRPSVCLSVCLSVMFRYRDHIGWNTSKRISRFTAE